MNPSLHHSALAAAIANRLGVRLHPEPTARVHGGSINECYRWESDDGPIFVKVAGAEGADMFEAEAAGLEELQAANAIRVPRVLDVGRSTDFAWLALEWISVAAGSPATDALMGEQLAKQHSVTRPTFGWRRSNTIGSTLQQNDPTEDWVRFYRDRRLRFQLELAAKQGHDGPLQRRGNELLEHVGEFFGAYRPVPALLHGDLWGGNRAADERGQPVIFDPAVYFGDREADLAMTRLFGGFGPEFYRAYAASWDMDPAAAVRTDLYNLYHVLNHLNLFGAGYLGQALSMLNRLLAHLGR
jgi:protein-ribulosamine 3-kinase